MNLSAIAKIFGIVAAMGFLVAACNGGGGGGGGNGGGVVVNPPCPDNPQPEIVYLRAATFEKQFLDGTTVTMWGYSKENTFGATTGSVSSPGPQIAINRCAQELRIRLDNDLPVTTSITINGLTQQMTPTFNGSGRVQSFTHETPPGNASYVEYVWSNLKPGSYLYESGTHPQVQVQMGLYGAVTQNQGINSAYGVESYDAEIAVVFSEVDPAIHKAVAQNDFGAGKSITSTVDYNARYFMVGGKEYMPGEGQELVARKFLIRFLNAGLNPKAPMMLNGYMKVVAEDGNLYPYPREEYALLLEPGKTKDVIINASEDTRIIADRALGFK